MDKRNGFSDLRLQCSFAEPLISLLKCPKGSISPYLSVKADREQSDKAVKWWNTRNSQEQQEIRSVIAAMAYPVLLTTVKVMLEDEAMVTSAAITSSMEKNCPFFLIGVGDQSDEYRISFIPDNETLIYALLDYVFASQAPGKSDLRITLPVTDFLVLLSIMDLYRRSRLISLIDHSEIITLFKREDIKMSLIEGLKLYDPRWLVPFVGEVMPNAPGEPDQPAIDRAIDNLASLGMIKASQDEGFELCESLLFPAASFYRKLTQLSLQVFGAAENGSPLGKSAVFIRGDRYLWFVGFGGEKVGTAFMTSVTLEEARDILEELFTPEGKPALIEEKEETPPAPVKAVMDEALSTTDSAGEDYVCDKCKAPLEIGAKFCQKCGDPVTKEDHRPKEAEDKCSRCQAQITGGSKFCVKCGAPVLREEPGACPGCKKPVKEGVNFCHECGMPVLHGKPREEFCSACNTPLLPGDKFCKKCGAPVPVS